MDDFNTSIHAFTLAPFVSGELNITPEQLARVVLLALKYPSGGRVDMPVLLNFHLNEFAPLSPVPFVPEVPLDPEVPDG